MELICHTETIRLKIKMGIIKQCDKMFCSCFFCLFLHELCDCLWGSGSVVNQSRRCCEVRTMTWWHLFQSSGHCLLLGH